MGSGLPLPAGEAWQQAATLAVREVQLSKPARLAVFLACLLGYANLSACSEPRQERSGVGIERQAPAMAQAEFRYVARETYKTERSRSCEAPFTNYALVLKDEVMAIRAFEAQNRLTAADFHLSLARADVDLNQDSCWADNDARFAARHVEMARGSLVRGLGTLTELATSLPKNVPSDTLPAATSAAFRAQIVQLVDAVHPLCPLSGDVNDEQITASAAARLADFKHNISYTAYALHFAIAEADAQFRRSTTVAECASPAANDPARISVSLEEQMASKIGAIQRQFSL